jgi:hypothetical protein
MIANRTFIWLVLLRQQLIKLMAKDWQLVLNNAPSDFVVDPCVSVDDLVTKADDALILGDLFGGLLICCSKTGQRFANDQELVIQCGTKQLIPGEID